MIDNQQEIATPDIKHTKARKVRSQSLAFGTTKWLTYAGLYSALAITMKSIGQYLTITPNFKITLIYTVWLMAGASLGVIGGGAVCFISDILGAILVSRGAVIPLLTLGNVIYGVIAALVFRYTPIKNYAVKFISAGIVCTVVCTCLINSLALYYQYGSYKVLTFWQYFVANRAFQPLVAAINVAVTVAMVPLMKRLHLLPALNKESQNTEEHDA